MAIVHAHMAYVAGQRRIVLGFSAQERVLISSEAVGLVAELDAADITIGTLLSPLGCPETVARP